MRIKQPNLLDIKVGRRLRALRLQRHISQSTLGDALGLTFQQIQKYEKGKNRITIGRLQQIANVLGVPASIFFKDEVVPSSSSASLLEVVDTASALRLVRAYCRISSPSKKQLLIRLAEELSTHVC